MSKCIVKNCPNEADKDRFLCTSHYCEGLEERGTHQYNPKDNPKWREFREELKRKRGEKT